MSYGKEEVSALGEWVGHTFFFSDALASDRRTPIITFSIPEPLLGLLQWKKEGSSFKFGILAPMIEFWIALIMTLLFGAVFNCFISCIIYYCIILPRKRKKKRMFNEALTPYLVGFGLIMPLCVVVPHYVNRSLFIQNKIMKFLNGSAQLMTFFRCSEAMFGFLPSSVDDSWTNLFIYMAFPIEIKFRNGPVKSTWRNVAYNFVNWVKYIIILGLYSSFLVPFGYQPFPNVEGPSILDINLLNGFSREQLINNFSMAVLFQIYLSTFGFGLNFLSSLCGAQPIQMMLNPIFESDSVSDFWGRRWNLTIHGILKRGVYKPVRACNGSQLMASTAAFVASGLFHEWMLSVVFFPDKFDQDFGSLEVGYGRNTLFFSWNAMLIGLEYLIGGFGVFQLLKKQLPVLLLSLMVASTALPVAHWFTNDYVRGDFFKDGQVGFPLIVRLQE